jgi:cellobiose-specific phosphotransferase system component IIA
MAKTLWGEDYMVDILRRAIGNMQSARAELAEAIRHMEEDNYAVANLDLMRATKSIRKAFGGVADCFANDFGEDEGEIEEPSWWGG